MKKKIQKFNKLFKLIKISLRFNYVQEHQTVVKY